MPQAQQQAPEPERKKALKSASVPFSIPDSEDINSKLDQLIPAIAEVASEDRIIDLSLAYKTALSSLPGPNEVFQARKLQISQDTKEALEDWISGLKATHINGMMLLGNKMSIDVTAIIKSRGSKSRGYFSSDENFLEREEAVARVVQRVKGWKGAKLARVGSRYELQFDWSDSPNYRREISDQALLNRINSPLRIRKLLRLTEDLMIPLEGLDKDEDQGTKTEDKSNERGEKKSGKKSREKSRKKSNEEDDEQSGGMRAETMTLKYTPSTYMIMSVIGAAGAVFSLKGAALMFSTGNPFVGLISLGGALFLGLAAKDSAKNFFRSVKKEVQDLLD